MRRPKTAYELRASQVDTPQPVVSLFWDVLKQRRERFDRVLDIVLTTPGLSVIIDAIKESRRIFQRMNSYAIYRIAETLRVLLFMTLAILIFNFYPLTAVMIVMLALLNDGAILSIAYDHVHYKDKPEAWNMRMVLGISTVLGIIGVVSAFGLFYLGERVFHLDRAHIQTLMYLKLSVAGHLTIFLTRTRGPFWSHRPARILWVAVVGTQIMATLIAVYGLFMTPLGWGWAGFVWGYALLWFLVNDRIKLIAYRIFDPVNAVASIDSKTEAKAKAQTDTKADPQADAKVETIPEPRVKSAVVVSFDKIVIREAQSNRSFKVFDFLAKSVREARRKGSE